VTIIGGVVYKKSMLFEVFWEYPNQFLIFIREIILVSRSYQVFVIHNKSLIIDVLDTQDTRLKVRFWPSCRFWRFWDFFELSVLAQVFSLGHRFFSENEFNGLTFTCSKRFFHEIKFWANNQYNADQIFVNSAPWSGPNKVPFSVVLIRKTWNLVSL